MVVADRTANSKLFIPFWLRGWSNPPPTLMNISEKLQKENIKESHKIAQLTTDGPFVAFLGFLLFGIGFTNTYGISLGILITMAFALFAFFGISFLVRITGG